MNRLEGKRALITGGTTGIGLATARAFVREGARVVVTGLNGETLAQAGDALGEHVIALQVDAGDAGAQRQLAQRIRSSLGQLDIAVLNAAIGVFKPLPDWDERSFDRSFDVNFKGPFFLLQSLLDVLASPASVILVGSVNAHIGLANSSVYSASKAALRSLGRTTAGELIGRGIRVNTLSPGPVSTPIYEKLGLPADALQQMRASLLSQLPAGRFGRPEEIADAAVFLASEESAYMTGAELVVDGGFIGI